MYGLDCFGNPSLSLLAIVLLFVTFIFGSSSIIFQRLRRIDKLLVICFLFATLISTLLCRGSIITTLNCLSLSGFHGSFNVSGFFLLLLDLALLELLKVLPDGLLEREGTVTKDFHDLWQVDRLLFQELVRQQCNQLSLRLEKFLGLFVALVDEVFDFFVDLGRCFITVGLHELIIALVAD